MLIDDIELYIALRQSLGAGLKRARQNLTSFARFAADRGERHICAQTAIAWAAMAPTPGTRHRRLSDVVRVARFLRAEDLAHEVPPAGLFTTSKTKLIPYIYAPDELARMLDAAREMQRHEPSPMRRQVYVMLFGLIATTGLRISEALNLRLGDVLPGGILHIRQVRQEPPCAAASNRCWRRSTLILSCAGMLSGRTITCSSPQEEEGSVTPR
jgi:integrase/recombinase XerD